jgi:hypothetical protein
MCKKFWKSWQHGLWDYNVWSGKKSFVPLYLAGATEFDHLWCKIFELHNFELLHHFNVHHVRYLCTKSLEVGDEWNILKCTLHWRRVQKISITQANLEEFLVNSLFHEVKSSVDMKVYSKFSKKIGKIWNLQTPWGMEDFNLPSIGARFKRLEKKLSKGFSQNSLFLLPTILGWYNQRLLVGYSTCSTCPYFSSNFQTPIVFDL